MFYLDPVLVRVTVMFKKPFIVKDYTAKIVKSLLINENPKLSEILSKRKSFPPKPIHITPLYVNNGSKLKAVYTKLVPRENIAKPPRIKELHPIRIESRRPYFFYIGVSRGLLNNIVESLTNKENLVFGNETVEIENLDISINYVNIIKESSNIYDALLIGKWESLKVVFESPTLLKDPLVVMRRKKKKLFLPLPEAVLSVPMFMALIDSGRYKNSVFLRCMRYIKSVFDTPYTALKTVNIVWYVYDNEVLPALIGYVKYYIDYEVLNHAQQVMKSKYNLDFIELLAKSLILARIYGVGDGRATGFGHIGIQLK